MKDLNGLLLCMILRKKRLHEVGKLVEIKKPSFSFMGVMERYGKEIRTVKILIHRMDKIPK